MPVEGTTVEFAVVLRPRSVTPTLAWRLDGDPAGGSGSAFFLPILSGFTAPRTVELEILAGSEKTKLVWRVIPVDPERTNVPPVIQAAFPSSTVSLLPDEEALLAVHAIDWDLKDLIRFLWTVDGQPQPSTSSPSFHFSSAGLGPGPHVVEVLVDDGRRTTDDPAPVQSWTVDVLAGGEGNRPPMVREALPPAAMRISAGSSLLLSIRAADPDSDPLAYTWRVDGLLQAERSSTFLFRAGQSQPRTSAVRVTVGDQGRSTEVDEFEWRIEVDGTAGPPPPPPPQGTSEVVLSWDPVNTDIFGNPRDVSGYRVYLSAFPGPFLLLGNVGDMTEATLSNLVSGRLYQFVVTAVDLAGNESPFSEAVWATPP